MKYEIWLTDPRGVRLALLDTFISLEWARVLNSVGHIAVELPDGDYPLDIDNMIQVWREPQDGELRLETIGLIRRVAYARQNGADIIQVGAPDLNELLARRIVLGAAGTANTLKTDYADDMLKELVNEALGSTAAYGRSLTPFGFTVASDLGQAPSLTKGCAYRNLLTTMQEIAAASAADGTELYFQIEAGQDSSGLLALSFQTYIGQPGADRTTGGGAPLFVGPEWGNIEKCYLEYDYSKEVNMVTGGGQGEGVARYTVTASDAVRAGKSIYNYREAFRDARSDASRAGVCAAANTALQEGRPRLRFGGSLLDVPGSRYGLDWHFGDRLECQYRGRQFAGLVRAVSVTVDSDGEKLAANIEAEASL